MTSFNSNTCIKVEPRDRGVDEKSQLIDLGKQLTKMLYTSNVGKHELAGMTIEIYTPLCENSETIELRGLLAHIGRHAVKHEIEIVLNNL